MANAIEKFHADRDAQWAEEVKIKAGWCCQECGELEKDMLEAHHIKPKSLFPKLRHDISNGKCLCIYCHALAHTGTVRYYILARLAVVLYRRLYPGKKIPDL